MRLLMRNRFITAAVATFLSTFVPYGSARETVALPYIFGVAAGDSVGQATGIDTTGAGLLTINNNININALNDVGGGITTNALAGATILFLGNSTITNFTGTNLIPIFNIRVGENATSVNFNGDVFSTTFHHFGTGTVNFNGNVNHPAPAGGASSYIFEGDGFLNIGPNVIFNSALTTTAGANTGTLTFNGGSSMSGAIGIASAVKKIIIVGGNVNLGGEVFVKDIDLAANTLSIVGQLTTSTGGKISTNFTSNSVFGHIVGAGAYNIDGPTITVIPTVSGALTIGTPYRIVSAISGSDATTVTVINSPRYTFTGSNTLGNVDLLLVSVAPLATLVTSPDALAIAPILDVNAPINSDLRLVQDAIGALPTIAAIDNALDQLVSANTNLAAPWVASQATQLFSNTWVNRLDELRDTCCDTYCNTNVNPTNKRDCKDNDKRSNFWVRSIGAFGKQTDSSVMTGYKTDAYGAMLGYDISTSKNTRVGVGAGYIRSTIDSNNSLNQTKIDSYDLTTYFNYAPEAFFIRGALIAGADKYDGTRHIDFAGINRIAKSDANGQQYTALITTGKNFTSKNTTLTPLVGVQASRINVDSYTEHGAGDINLQVDSQNYNFLQSTVGVKLEHVMQSKNLTVAPEIHTKWMHDFKSTTAQQDAVLTGGGSKFHIHGIEQESNSYNVGAGVTLYSCNCDKDSWSVKGAYDYKWNETGYQNNQVSVVASIKF